MNIKFKITQQDFIEFYKDKFLCSKEFRRLLMLTYIYLLILYVIILIFFKSILFSVFYFVMLGILFKFRYVVFSKFIMKLLYKLTSKKSNQYIFEVTNILLDDNFLIVTNIYREKTLRIKNVHEILSNDKLICIKFNTGDTILFPKNIKNSTEFLNNILNIKNLKIKEIIGEINENSLQTK